MRNIPLALLLVLCATSHLFAICQEPKPRLVCQEYFQADATVIARIESSSYHKETRNRDDYHLYVLTTVKLLRGKVPERFLVVEENNSGRSGLDWIKGQQYLLFLTKAREPNRWYVQCETNSASLAASNWTLRTIEKLTQAGPGGLISGNVRDDGVMVQVKGTSKSFKLRPDADGNFRVRVPNGDYVVTASSANGILEPGLFSADDPSAIHIENGKCVQLEFEAPTPPRRSEPK